ncbi:hypothetical protein PPERSA_06864 [Pseudocohnilembus persalinus]|uniref:Ribosomal protein L27 n=1 Tax=Pseudocohnilembus persalinus TaxID=266149 RepID=A0A0V0QSE5_PSEPJ|nr:hypothetical protein PPERSA_06864 [Pseudocohnilembus persalinus]|eukprot:KRX05230.1 hypothetical protein PPERSA_06864 [Pseudocohnilembus persalinus]
MSDIEEDIEDSQQEVILENEKDTYNFSLNLDLGTLERAQQVSEIMNNTFATKMQASSTRKTKDSAGRRLGVKKLGDNEVFPMDILVRQRGFRWHPGANTYVGRDHTIHSKIEGIVKFSRDPWRQRKKITISVEPKELPSRRKYKTTPPPPYCYHPELYPELAKNNPEPTNLRISKYELIQPPVKVVGSKSEKRFTKSVQIPQEYLERQQTEIPSASQQYKQYLDKIDTITKLEGQEQNNLTQ